MAHDETAARRDRALGAFMGLAVGDALGTTIEFSRRDSTPPVTDMIGGGPFGLKPGEWTDDTSMALCLADSLVVNDGDLDPLDLAQRFLRWWKQGENSVTGRCFDIGNATRSALAAFARTGTPRGDDHPHAAGNGGVMRLAPAALAAKGDAARAVFLSRAQSEVTHAAAECLDAAEALALVLNAGILGDGKAALDAAAGARLSAPKVAAVAAGSWRGRSRATIRSTGYVVDTLEASLWAVSGSDSFEEAVLKAVNLGADRVGVVTGQIAGAVWGLAAIPERWRRTIAWRDRLVAKADTLWGAPQVQPPGDP